MQDSDLDELNAWAPKLMAALQKLPELQDVASDQQTDSTKVSLVIDRDQAARFGIQPQLIDATLTTPLASVRWRSTSPSSTPTM